jgi:hypothetical protein
MTSQAQPTSRLRTDVPPIRRLDRRHLARHARVAVRERLLYPAPYALRAVEREGTAVILRLNSGGNALAVTSYLRQRGYGAEWAGTNPDGYGCAVRVTCPSGAGHVSALDSVPAAPSPPEGR